MGVIACQGCWVKKKVKSLTRHGAPLSAIQYFRGWNRRIAVSSIPAWDTYWVQGQPGQQYKTFVLWNNKQKTIEKLSPCSYLPTLLCGMLAAAFYSSVLDPGRIIYICVFSAIISNSLPVFYGIFLFPFAYFSDMLRGTNNSHKFVRSQRILFLLEICFESTSDWCDKTLKINSLIGKNIYLDSGFQFMVRWPHSFSSWWDKASWVRYLL